MFFYTKHMFYFVLFLFELVLLFVSSLFLMPVIAKLFFKLTRSKTVSVHLLFYLFLPGIIIHELSHALCAGLLLVPIGQLKLYPEISEGGVRFGSIEVAHTDFLRRFIIGVAPTIFGVFLLFGILYSLIQKSPFFLNSVSPLLLKSILIYLLFTIANTMFSSKKDLEGVGGLVVLVAFLLIMLYFSGININLDFLKGNLALVRIADFYLFVPLIVNVGFYGGISFLFLGKH